MSDIRLLLDEDVWPGLGEAMRQNGYDAVSVHELERRGLSDEEQMRFATAAKRAIITHNIRDFAPLAQSYAAQRVTHWGIIVAPKLDKGSLIKRTLNLLHSLTAEQLQNTLRFV